MRGSENFREIEFEQPMEPEKTESGYQRQQLIDTELLPIYQEIATKHGLSIEPIAKEGEEYTFDNSMGRHKGIVPKGKIYANFLRPQKDLSAFWEELKQELAKRNQGE